MGTGVDLSSLSEKLKLNELYDVKNSNLISDIIDGKIKFVSIIESLSDVLTNQEVVIRERGMDFLSWILTEAPPDLFSSQEITVIVNFYRDRFNDHHNIAPATIRGLLAVVKMNNIEKESIRQFIVPLFQEMNCQTQQQLDRYNIFSIVGYIVENHIDIVAAMGFDFVFGIISLADGETDPTNLLLLFQFLPFFLKNIDLGHLMEEMFDLLACYFPIDFNDAGKNITVTRQELSDGLMNCLCAKADFANHCLPLIFEKLDSTHKPARIDSYKLLGVCCSTYTVSSISKYSNEIWKVIQKDVLPAVDKHITEAALFALSEVVRLFASEENTLTLKHFLDDVLTSVRSLFNNVEDSLFHPAINVLLAVSSNSLQAAKYVLSHLRSVFSSDTVKTQSQKKIALSSLNPFLPILKSCEFNKEEHSPLFTEISHFYLESAKSKDYEIRKIALLGLEELVSDFSYHLREQLIKLVADCIKNEEDVRSECLKILRLLGSIAPDEILKLLETDFEVNTDSSTQPTNLKAFAFAISAVADVGSITQYAIPQMLNLITSGFHYDIGLACLLNSCQTAESEDFMKRIHKDYNVTERLINWWFEGLSENKCLNDASMGNLSEIIALNVRHQETCVQQSIIDRCVPLLLNDVERNDQTERNVILVEAMVGSVRQNVKLEKFPSLSSRLVTSAVKSNGIYVRMSSSRLLASILNKMGNHMEVNHLLESVTQTLSDSHPVVERRNATVLLTWIVKGLLLANSPTLEPFILLWFSLLEREDVGEIVAEGFELVLKEEKLYLNMGSHCNIKILYRQRFFTYFQKLVKMFESSEDGSRDNYLLALIHAIKGVPKHVTLTEASSVVAIVAKALNCERHDVLLPSLEILHGFLSGKECLFADYAQSLIPKLIGLACVKGSMKIRMSALKCLYDYAFYPTTTILPIRAEVVRSLECCLDDKKRLVRTEAVKARSRWYLVGAPGEEAIFS